MERMTGIPIAQVDRLREAGIDIPRLARAGVELFFTQVFRDGFFHADMHPGNIFVATDGRTTAYIASTSGSWGRSRSATRTISRRISLRSFAATTTGRARTSNPAGCRRTRAWTSSRPRSASCWSPLSTGRCGRSRSAAC